METFKTYLFFSGYDEGHPYLIDTIFHEDAWWLVASWLSPYTSMEKIPERLIRLTGLRFQEIEGESYRFLLNNALPYSLIDGEEKSGYVTSIYSHTPSKTRGSSSTH